MVDLNPQNKTTAKRLLLWSPFGSGQHYCGPATYTHRVYSKLDPSEFHCSLAHGYLDQTDEPVFKRQHFVHRFGGGISANWQFASKGRRWFNDHKSEFDLFHAISGFHGSVSIANLAREAGIPVVLFISILNGGLSSHNGLKKMLGIYHRRRKMTRRFDALIALSSEIEQQLLSLKFAPQQIVRIPNFADTDKFCRVDDHQQKLLKRSLGMKECPAIAFVGRLSERKRPHLILEALKELRHQNHEMQCALIGPYEPNDPYYLDIKRYIEENDLSDHVVFSGFTTKVESWLQACDLFCLPSLNEGMPGALIEAISCGLPAIVSPFSSANEVVDDREIGVVLSEDGGAKEIAAAVIEELTQLPNNREHRRNAIVQRYSLNAIAQQHADLFRRLIQGNTAKI
jgi:glycosyltransferase involved in cell wall biosynthesis